MRKEEWLRRKWKEDKDKSHLEICSIKCRENKILPMRKEECWRRKWKKDKDSMSHYIQDFSKMRSRMATHSSLFMECRGL